MGLDDLTWSPGSTMMAYSYLPDGNRPGELVVFGSDGSHRRSLVNRCCLVWSPDGTSVAIGTNRSGRIYVARADEFGLRRKLQAVLMD